MHPACRSYSRPSAASTAPMAPLLPRPPSRPRRETAGEQQPCPAATTGRSRAPKKEQARRAIGSRYSSFFESSRFDSQIREDPGRTAGCVRKNARPARAQTQEGIMQSFLRFLFLCGETETHLASAMPTVRQRRYSTVALEHFACSPSWRRASYRPIPPLCTVYMPVGAFRSPAPGRTPARRSARPRRPRRRRTACRSPCHRCVPASCPT